MGDELERFLANARGTAASAANAPSARSLLSPGAKVMSLDELRARRGPQEVSTTWSLATLRGRLVELSARGASATLSTAMEIVVDAQTQREPVAWLTLGNATFYPPDVADCGIDLEALVVVRVTDVTSAARAGERLLRSGAFGLIVIDLGANAELNMQMQGRLVTLAQTHDAAVVCLTEKAEDTASLGSLVSLRAEALRMRERDEFAVSVRVIKDKRRGPGWSQSFKRRGPAGLT